MRRWVAVVALCGISPLLLNCYGRFPLTRTVYDINGNFENSIVRTVVFWAFVIFPVYGIAMLADAVVLNLVDFWTGEGVELTRATDEQGNEYMLEPGETPREALLTVERPEGTVRMRFVRREDGNVDVFDADGELAGRILPDDAGNLRLTDAEGRTMEVINPRQLSALAAR